MSLEQRIIDTILVDAKPDVAEIFAALQGALTFCLSLVCADCRHQLSETLRASLPLMEKTAGEFAQSQGIAPTQCLLRSAHDERPGWTDALKRLLHHAS